MTIYHDYIAPWFDRFIQLPEGNLRSLIENLANSVEFPLTKILVIEGSKRSAHSNAYFFGFFKNKRVVLFDTLLRESPFEREKQEEELKKQRENQDEVKTDQGNGTEKEVEARGLEGRNEATIENSCTSNYAEVDNECEKKPVKGCSDEEILAVLGHEFGHWKMNHTLKHMVIGQVRKRFCF